MLVRPVPVPVHVNTLPAHVRIPHAHAHVSSSTPSSFLFVPTNFQESSLTAAQVALANAQTRIQTHAQKAVAIDTWTPYGALALSEQSGVTMRIDGQVKFFSHQQLVAGALVLHHRMCLTMGDTRVSGEDLVDFTQPTLEPIPIGVSTPSFSGISSLPAADVK